jgi:hypothetical protein
MNCQYVGCLQKLGHLCCDENALFESTMLCMVHMLVRSDIPKSSGLKHVVYIESQLAVKQHAFL